MSCLTQQYITRMYISLLPTFSHPRPWRGLAFIGSCFTFLQSVECPTVHFFTFVHSIVRALLIVTITRFTPAFLSILHRRLYLLRAASVFSPPQVSRPRSSSSCAFVARFSYLPYFSHSDCDPASSNITMTTANPFSDDLYRVNSNEHLDDGKTLIFPATIPVPYLKALPHMSTSPSSGSPSSCESYPPSTAPTTPSPTYPPLKWTAADLSKL